MPGTSSPVSPKATLSGAFPFLWSVSLFRSPVLSVLDWPTLRRQTTPRAGAAVELEVAYRPVDRLSGERQTATLGDGAERPTEAEHVRTCYGRAGPLLGTHARKCARVFAKRHVPVCSQHSSQTPAATVEQTGLRRTTDNSTQHRTRLTSTTGVTEAAHKGGRTVFFTLNSHRGQSDLCG